MRQFLGLRAQVFQLMSLCTVCEPRAGDENHTLVDLGDKVYRVSGLKLPRFFY